MAIKPSISRSFDTTVAAHVLLLLVTFTLYWPALHFEYLDFDDQLYIQNDPAVQNLNLATLKTILVEPYASAWYPLTRLSFALEFMLFEGSPFGTHLINVLLHFISAILVMQLLLLIGERLFIARQNPDSMKYAALFASLLFVVHPQHMEAVAWAVQRKELLASMFGLWSIRTHFLGRPLASAILLCAAIMSKGSAIIVSALILLISLALLRPAETSARRVLLVLWSVRWLLLISIAGAIVTMMTHTAEDALYQGMFDWPTRLAIYAYNCLLGISQFVVFRPAMFHLPLNDTILAGGFLAQAVLVAVVLILLGCTYLTLKSHGRWKLAAAGLLCYLVALIPVAGIMIFGNYAFGDRYLYLNSLGLYLVVFAASDGLLQSKTGSGPRTISVAIMGGYLIACAWSVHETLPKFKNTESVWAHDVAHRPDAVFANHQLGSLYFFEGKMEMAAVHFEAAINSASEPFRVASRQASALYLAEIHCRNGRSGDAIDILSRISGFGGDVTLVEPFLVSIRHAGLESCADTVSDWYQKRQSGA